LNAILENAGRKTALSNTIRFKIADDSTPNLHKMSMPGRFFLQRFLRKAVDAKCQYAVIEMTSQGALLHRHRFIDLDTLIFTNLSPEHIEAHGSYEKYVDAKVSIAENMRSSCKAVKTIIVNDDDDQADRFLACHADRKITYSIHDVEPYKVKAEGLEFTLNGRPTHSPLSGLFNLHNILAAVTAAESEHISPEMILEAIESFERLPGRVERIDAGQNFEVVVDYAHTADSLEKLYKVFRPDPTTPCDSNQTTLKDPDQTASKDPNGSGGSNDLIGSETRRLIAVLGGTGGGRDAWKRKEMGRLADLYCDAVILTNEDPYDEDPNKIIADVAVGITSKKPLIVMDRREAIREALKLAQKGDAVLITGKGTDPYIMGPNGTKTPWSDAGVAKEEIERLIR
jgi:UDP-N-acetylmuramyl tripeptide synthase